MKSPLGSSRGCLVRHLVLWQHAGVFQYVGPFATRPRVAMLQMLPEVVRPVEFLGRIAFPKFVYDF